jgi:hypothetical protein
VSRLLRTLLALAVLGGLLWLLGARSAFARDWVFDVTTGNDTTGSGTAGAPFKTFGKFLSLTTASTGCPNAAQVCPGDVVKFRPGRYSRCDGAASRFTPLVARGTAGNPITVTIDTTQPGDVEFHGGAIAGQCALPAWQQARTCTTGAHIGAACDSSTECDGGTCSVLPGVWWTTSAFDNNSQYWGGMGAGTVYQPNKAAGLPPKIYEIVYAPPGLQVKLTTFTPGKNQALAYATLPPGGGGHGGGTACKASRTPWLCCTGDGGGSCSTSRIYVQTASGASPSSVADATYGEVEVPVAMEILKLGTKFEPAYNATPTTYLTFTNNNNGRLFHFRWPLTGPFLLYNTDHFVLEDFTAGYQSRVTTYKHIQWTSTPHSSGFPRYLAGDTYQLTGWWDSTNGGEPPTNNVVRNTEWRRFKFHGAQGNESVHFLGDKTASGLARFFNHTFEYGTFCETPLAYPTGQATSDCTPNAETGQTITSWPPPGVCVGGANAGALCKANATCASNNCNGWMAWDQRYSHGFWSPLGGGGDSDGAFISSAHQHTVRNCRFSATGLISFFESGGAGNLTFENNYVDLWRQQYADIGYDPGQWPNVLVSRCLSDTQCGGFTGALSLAFGVRFENAGVRGAIVRNNVFVSGYGNVLRTGYFLNYGDSPPTIKPVTPPIVANNTWHLKGDFIKQINDNPVIWLGYANSDVNGVGMDAADGSKAIFKNNIIIRDTASVLGAPMIQVQPNAAGTIDFGYNNWGASNNIWAIGEAEYTTLGAWQDAIGGDANSIAVDPRFVSNYNNVSLCVGANNPVGCITGSPSYQTGLNLSGLAAPLGFSTDIEGTARGTNWSRGAYQGAATGATIPTTTSLPTTTTTTTSTTTTTIAGVPPLNWTNDASTVAWWPFEGTSANTSTATTYCTGTNGNLTVAANGAQFTYLAPAAQGTLALNNGDGSGVLQGPLITGAGDCLRAQSPTAWTVSLWLKATVSARPAAEIIRNGDAVGNGWSLRMNTATGLLTLCAGGTACNVGVVNLAFPLDNAWHLVTARYTGPGGSFSLALDANASSATGPGAVSFNRNNWDGLGFPFLMPNGGITGSQDATWWLDSQLSNQQVCRIYAVQADGSRGFCDGSNQAAWRACTTDTDCGGRSGACNTQFPSGGKAGSCVGRLSTTPATCNELVELGPCNAALSTGATTSTTTSTSSTTTSSTLNPATATLRGAGGEGAKAN